MSLAVATKYSDRIRAAIDILGISNFVTFLEIDMQMLLIIY